jgi:hypothetical protein
MVETFDGDTPQADRTRIRENASGEFLMAKLTESNFHQSGYITHHHHAK